jgi:SAM-dependent methyltransferase
MTILREEEHKALKGIELSGKVLDLGGDKRSEYKNLFVGDFKITTVDINPKADPDITANLEEPLPIADASYDAALLINVLEHIYEFKQVISETSRVLVSGGKVVIVVPYMFPNHPSPGDYHRFSQTALEKLLNAAGFEEIEVKALGSGVYAARLLFLERLLPSSLQNFFAPISHTVARINDGFMTSIANTSRKKYRASDYALGFLVTARKP